jgi:predicted ATPase/DNA-binding winged helix-turn-helix (wHTH) protein
MAVEERPADEAWRVDWANECVWHEGARVRLPPKAFAVLRILMEQAGQVVTKEALLEAIWPDAVVTEAVLTVCIGELRKVLGETAQAPHFIQTVHRRGYRFMGQLPTVTAPASPASAPALPLPPSAPPLLVGREGVVAQLRRWWAHVRQGTRQVVFLPGEPGMGKTAVVDAFLAEVAAAGDVWLARGQCIEHYGAGEAYLPLLEALGRLGREPGGAALLPVLEQHAPTWLVQMPALLSAAALAAVQRRILGATPERMVRECAEAVEVLTVTRPLLLVLEDLHWSDHATLDLLTYLARRPGPARLLILGTYRPVEVLLRGHPLQTVKRELGLQGQAVELPLELLTADEVAQYLALRCAGGAELPPAGHALAQRLYQRTDGHPLFMITMVEHLLQRGVLLERPGPWEVSPAAVAAALEVPASIRQLIEQQFNRLSPEEQRLLEAASVAGSACTAAAVAAGLELAVEAVEDGCAGLAQRGQFLVASGLETWPDGTVTERYGWQHAVHQEVVYARVPEGRRLRLHRRIGAREEAGYGVRVSERAAALAMHFERGQDYQRAVHYLHQAAENAAQRYAPQEVIALLTKGVELLTALPETRARVQREVDMLLALGTALLATKGYAAPEVAQTYTRAQQLCHHLDDPHQRFSTLRGLWNNYHVRAELQTAQALGEQLLTLAQQVQETVMLMTAHRALGNTLFMRGAVAAAHTHFAQALALYDAPQHRAAPSLFVEDVGVICLSRTSWTLWYLGYPDQALARSQAAVTLAHQVAHPLSLSFALGEAAVFHQFRREGPAAQEHAAAALQLTTDQGFPHWRAYGALLHGWALAHQGEAQEGIAQLQQGMLARRATGAALARPYFLSLLVEVYGATGQPEAGLTALTEAFTLVETSGEGWYVPELYRLKGTLLLKQSPDHQIEAEVCFQQAIRIAQSQHAKSLELRAATSLARLWQQQGKRTEASALLAAVYGWFTEGFDTADLQEAKALLEELAE